MSHSWRLYLFFFFFALFCSVFKFYLELKIQADIIVTCSLSSKRLLFGTVNSLKSSCTLPLFLYLLLSALSLSLHLLCSLIQIYQTAAWPPMPQLTSCWERFRLLLSDTKLLLKTWPSWNWGRLVPRCPKIYAAAAHFDSTHFPLCVSAQTRSPAWKLLTWLSAALQVASVQSCPSQQLKACSQEACRAVDLYSSLYKWHFRFIVCPHLTMNPNALYSKTHFNNSISKSHFSVVQEKGHYNRAWIR